MIIFYPSVTQQGKIQFMFLGITLFPLQILKIKLMKQSKFTREELDFWSLDAFSSWVEACPVAAWDFSMFELMSSARKICSALYLIKSTLQEVSRGNVTDKNNVWLTNHSSLSVDQYSQIFENFIHLTNLLLNFLDSLLSLFNYGFIEGDLIVQ